jgi:hypothetical protein
MTTRRESWAAGREAVHQLTEHPDQPQPHEEALIRYLAGAAAVEAHRGEHSVAQSQPTRR